MASLRTHIQKLLDFGDSYNTSTGYVGVSDNQHYEILTWGDLIKCVNEAAVRAGNPLQDEGLNCGGMNNTLKFWFDTGELFYIVQGESNVSRDDVMSDYDFFNVAYCLYAWMDDSITNREAIRQKWSENMNRGGDVEKFCVTLQKMWGYIWSHFNEDIKDELRHKQSLKDLFRDFPPDKSLNESVMRHDIMSFDDVDDIADISSGYVSISKESKTPIDGVRFLLYIIKRYRQEEDFPFFVITYASYMDELELDDLENNVEDVFPHDINSMFFGMNVEEFCNRKTVSHINIVYRFDPYKELDNFVKTFMSTNIFDAFTRFSNWIYGIELTQEYIQENIEDAYKKDADISVEKSLKKFRDEYLRTHPEIMDVPDKLMNDVRETFYRGEYRAWWKMYGNDALKTYKDIKERGLKLIEEYKTYCASL